MKSHCPPELVLQGFFFEGKETTEIQEHLQSCSVCQVRIDQWKKDRGLFLKKYPFERLWKKIEDRDRKGFWKLFRWKWLLPVPLRGTLALATVASLMLFVLWQQVRSPMILSKGGVGLGFYASHDGRLERGRDRISLSPGDELQFLYTTQRDRFLILFGVEADRTLTVYYPAGGSSGAPVPLGKKRPLPQAVRWQPHSPYERFFALFSEEPISRLTLESALGKEIQEGKSVEAMKRLPLPYSQVSILVYKKNKNE